MFKFLLFTTVLFSLTMHTAFAQNKQLIAATQNFENNCVRATPTATLIKDKVQQHSFHLEITDGDLPILMGLESAQLEKNQSIRLKNSGCEYYTFDIQLVLNAEKIERNHQLCQDCLIVELKNLAQYFQIEDREFYLEGIKTLEQQFKKNKSFKVGSTYQLDDSEEIPQIFLFNKIKKQSNGQYWIEFTNSVGPL